MVENIETPGALGGQRVPKRTYVPTIEEDKKSEQKKPQYLNRRTFLIGGAAAGVTVLEEVVNAEHPIYSAVVNALFPGNTKSQLSVKGANEVSVPHLVMESPGVYKVEGDIAAKGVIARVTDSWNRVVDDGYFNKYDLQDISLAVTGDGKKIYVYATEQTFTGDTHDTKSEHLIFRGQSSKFFEAPVQTLSFDDYDKVPDTENIYLHILDVDGLRAKAGEGVFSLVGRGSHAFFSI